MKLYAILIVREDGTEEEHVIESDNRGIKGGITPPHVLRYAHEYARKQRARRVEVCAMVSALVTGEGVVRIEQRNYTGGLTFFTYHDDGTVEEV